MLSIDRARFLNLAPLPPVTCTSEPPPLILAYLTRHCLRVLLVPTFFSQMSNRYIVQLSAATLPSSSQSGCDGRSPLLDHNLDTLCPGAASTWPGSHSHQPHHSLACRRKPIISSAPQRVHRAPVSMQSPGIVVEIEYSYDKRLFCQLFVHPESQRVSYVQG